MTVDAAFRSELAVLLARAGSGPAAEPLRVALSASGAPVPDVDELELWLSEAAAAAAADTGLASRIAMLLDLLHASA